MEASWLQVFPEKETRVHSPTQNVYVLCWEEGEDSRPPQEFSVARMQRHCGERVCTCGGRQKVPRGRSRRGGEEKTGKIYSLCLDYLQVYANRKLFDMVGRSRKDFLDIHWLSACVIV